MRAAAYEKPGFEPRGVSIIIAAKKCGDFIAFGRPLGSGQQGRGDEKTLTAGPLWILTF